MVQKKGEPKFIIWSPPTFRKIVLGVLNIGIWNMVVERKKILAHCFKCFVKNFPIYKK